LIHSAIKLGHLNAIFILIIYIKLNSVTASKFARAFKARRLSSAYTFLHGTNEKGSEEHERGN
jgi:hypothetical protein